MKTSRVIITVLVLVAFTVGLNIGLFLGGGSEAQNQGRRDASGSAADSSSTFDPAGSPARGSRRIIDRAPVAGQDTAGVAGEEVISRAWTALTDPNDNTRHAAWLAVMATMTEREAREIRELFRKRLEEGFHHDYEWVVFWAQWGEMDGRSALEHVLSAELKDHQQELADRVMRGWAKADPLAARAWLEANVSSPLYSSALTGYVRGLAKVDLAGATQAALALGKDLSKANFVMPLVEQAAQQRQLGGMLDWWRALPDEPGDSSLRAVALQPIVERLTRANPALAQAFVTEIASSKQRSDELIGDFAGRLASKNPADAVNWVASLPPSPTDGHYSGIGRSVKAWMARDAAAADAWIAALPPSPLRDQAVEAKNPSQAITLSTKFIEAHSDAAILKSLNALEFEGTVGNKPAVKNSLQFLFQGKTDSR
jgi:hypothetical protein